MANQLYKLTLKRGYPQDTHHRAGLVLARGGALITELSKDQLEAVKNDAYIEVSKAAAGEQSQAAPLPEDEGAGVASNAHVGTDAPDRSASEETQTDEDQPPVATQTGDSTAAGADPSDIEGAEGTEPVSGEAGSEPTRGGEEAGEGEQAPGSDAAQDQPGSTPATDSPADPSAAAEGQDAAQNDAQEEEVTADTLVRDHSREELNAIAIKEGVSNAAELDNKQQVATAIIKVRAAAGN